MKCSGNYMMESSRKVKQAGLGFYDEYCHTRSSRKD